MHADYYASNGNVNKIEVLHDNIIQAKVIGSRKYSIELILENSEIRCVCSCPFVGVCKHALATIIFINSDEFDFDLIQKQSHFELKAYLEQLNKQELIQLILENKSDSLIRKLENKTRSTEFITQKIKQLKLEIDRLFNELDWETDKDWFDDKLSALFMAFDGAWHNVVREIKDLLIQCISQINSAIEDGYLYDHYNDQHFTGESFCKMFKTFINGILFDDKLNVISSLDNIELHYFEVLTQYDIKNELFTLEDIPYLIGAFKEGKVPLNFISSFYNLVKNELNDSDKELILKKYCLCNEEFVIDYVNLLEERFLLKDAEVVLSNFFDLHPKNKFNHATYKKWIELKIKLNESELEMVNTLMEVYPIKENAVFAIQNFPESKMDFETILYEKNKHEFVLYLEDQNRLVEAERVVSAKNSFLMDDFAFSFYTRHAKTFHNQSTEYLTNYIVKNLRTTGDLHYYAVAKGLKELFKFNADQAFHLLKVIRTDYKRRRNLMSILSDL